MVVSSVANCISILDLDCYNIISIVLTNSNMLSYCPDDVDRKGPRNISFSLKYDAPDDRDYRAEGLCVHSLLITGGGGEVV
jgi:hypothetical protein